VGPAAGDHARKCALRRTTLACERRLVRHKYAIPVVDATGLRSQRRASEGHLTESAGVGGLPAGGDDDGPEAEGFVGGDAALADFALCGQLSHDSEDRALLLRCFERDASGCQLLPQVALVAAVLADGSHDRVRCHDHRACVGLPVPLAVVLHGAWRIVARVERLGES